MKIPTPGLFTSGDFKKDSYALVAKFIRTKDIETLQEQPNKTNLKKCLTIVDLTSLGVGSCVGTGMYLVSGLVAKTYAGPAVLFSFLIAAFASILSGACYAEFGVRVPHTSGSAYMYSYVTVGELIAFVIGWNMVLEYLIGTAACACALSACLDSITRGALNDTVYDTLGTIFGHTPDVLAFAITLLMMVVLALGVKKSLIFNNVLNIINFASWAFLMSAGLFYINTDNWSNFLPYGWAGVFEGAATCFYAFIGFDIIATTGEEAHNPKKSIPLGIILSLIIISVAYVTSSMMLTLIVPYDEISVNSALVAMFGQVGARKCQMMVVTGAVAGLTVSMFGSMFPMPRIIYAMAKDGLLFRFLSPIFEWTGTPLIATVVSGITAAFAALFLNLQILVEMMSIGTLLAYTLVSTCVLLLRYQPHSTSIVQLLPEALKTPRKGSPVKEHATTNNEQSMGEEDGPSLVPSNSSGPTSASWKTPSLNRKVNIRRITRSSPDSDDSLGDECDGGNEDIRDNCMDDSQKLVADKRDKKHYGTTLHRITPVPKTIDEKVSEGMENVKQRLRVITYLCPAFFPWIECGPATEESGKAVLRFVSTLYVLILFFDVIMVYGSRPLTTFNTFLVYLLLLAIVVLTAVISRKPQNKKDLLFSTPAVPFVPVIAIAVNIYLILNLSVLTLVRFIVWMILGFIIYLYYGIKYSSLESNISETGDSVVESPYRSATPQVRLPGPQVTRTSEATKSSAQPFRGQKEEPKTRPETLDTLKTGSCVTRSDLFVSPSSFPTWDD